MQFDNPSVFQAKKVQLFDRFCQSLHSFIGNLSCFSDFSVFVLVLLSHITYTMLQASRMPGSIYGSCFPAAR